MFKNGRLVIRVLLLMVGVGMSVPHLGNYAISPAFASFLWAFGTVVIFFASMEIGRQLWLGQARPAEDIAISTVGEVLWANENVAVICPFDDGTEGKAVYLVQLGEEPLPARFVRTPTRGFVSIPQNATV